MGIKILLLNPAHHRRKIGNGAGNMEMNHPRIQKGDGT